MAVRDMGNFFFLTYDLKKFILFPYIYECIHMRLQSSYIATYNPIYWMSIEISPCILYEYNTHGVTLIVEGEYKETLSFGT